MPGGFHPFHAGHYALYKSALEAFPQADVYVAATNDQSERPFPFSIKEKLAKLAGVKQGRFVQVKSPFQAKEITQNYDPNSDVLIFVRSEKDKTEQPKPGGTKKDGSPAYFQPWTGKDLQPFSKHAYIAYLPTVTFGPGIQSATEIRKAWPTLDDRRKTAMVMSLYPATQKNPKLAQNVVQLLDMGMGGQEGVAEGAPIVVMPRADRLKKPEPTKVRYQGDIVPPTQPPSTEKRGVKGRPGQRPMPKYDEDINEGLGDYITKKIDDFLDAPKISPQQVARLMKQAPSNLPDDVAEKLVAKFMETEKAKRLAQQAADANKTTIEKIVPYLTYFGRVFVDRWKQIPQRDRDNALKNLVHNIGRFLLFILESLLKGATKKESVGEAEDVFMQDPESDKILRYAQQHYPNAQGKQQAFMKFVQRALMHSKEEDETQDEKLEKLEQMVNKLADQLNKVNESTDYIEEK